MRGKIGGWVGPAIGSWITRRPPGSRSRLKPAVQADRVGQSYGTSDKRAECRRQAELAHQCRRPNDREQARDDEQLALAKPAK
jgi:hypothetical protein